MIRQFLYFSVSSSDKEARRYSTIPTIPTIPTISTISTTSTSATISATSTLTLNVTVTPAPSTPIPNPEVELRNQPAELQIDLDEPLYTEQQAKAAIAQFRPIEYDTELEIAPGIHARYLDAGHILGSAIIRVRVVEREGGPERTIVFSGDLGRPGTPIIRDPTVLTDADYVLIETTYGGREHEPGDAIDQQQPEPDPEAAAVRVDQAPGLLPGAWGDRLLGRSRRGIGHGRVRNLSRAGAW